MQSSKCFFFFSFLGFFFTHLSILFHRLMKGERSLDSYLCWKEQVKPKEMQLQLM